MIWHPEIAQGIENAIFLLALIAGLAAIWICGYLKGRWDAGRSIGSRYHLTPRT